MRNIIGGGGKNEPKLIGKISLQNSGWGKTQSHIKIYTPVDEHPTITGPFKDAKPWSSLLSPTIILYITENSTARPRNIRLFREKRR